MRGYARELGVDESTLVKVKDFYIPCGKDKCICPGKEKCIGFGKQKYMFSMSRK